MKTTPWATNKTREAAWQKNTYEYILKNKNPMKDNVS